MIEELKIYKDIDINSINDKYMYNYNSNFFNLLHIHFLLNFLNEC